MPEQVSASPHPNPDDVHVFGQTRAQAPWALMVLVFSTVAGLALAGCDGATHLGVDGASCTKTADCEPELACIDQVCVSGTPDGQTDDEAVDDDVSSSSESESSDDPSASSSTSTTGTTGTTGDTSGASADDDDVGDGDGDDDDDDDDDDGDEDIGCDLDSDSGEDGPDSGGEAGCEEILCDPGSPDGCGAGMKCGAWACADSCCTNSAKCTRVLGNKGAGDDCRRDAEAQIDDCGPTLFCMPNGGSTGTGGCGRCEQHCSPTPGQSGNCDELGYPDEFHCFAFNRGSFPVCLETCDPLERDCPGASDECYLAIDNFICMRPTGPDGSSGGDPGLPGDECAVEMGCAGGSVCLPSRLDPACNNEDCGVGGEDACGCCATLCDLSASDPNANCEPGRVCVPAIEIPGDDVKSVGACVTG